MRQQLERFLHRRDLRRNKTLTCALIAEHSRTSPASSGSTAALDCMAKGLKKSSKGRERRKDKENEEGVGQCSKLFNLLFQNSLLPSLFLRLSLPSSSFLGQPRRRPSVHPLFYVRDGGRDKENEKNVAAVQQTVNSLLFNLLFLVPRPLSSASFLGDPQRGPLLLRERAFAALRFLSPSSPLFPLVHPPNSFPLFACVCKTD